MTEVIEQWIHTKDGVLRPDNPYENVGQQFIITKADYDSYRNYNSHTFVGCRAVIDETAAYRNGVSKRRTKTGKTNVAQILLTTKEGRRRRIKYPKSCMKVA